MRRWVPPLDTQCLQKLAESGERGVLTLGSLCLSCCVLDTAQSWKFIINNVTSAKWIVLNWHFRNAITEKLNRTIHNRIPSRTMSGSVRYCNRCVIVKPDRAHHCSICARCVLKMDHHCPWVNNCVCFHNYKFFMLFLGYALFYCLFIMSTCLPYFIRFWKVVFVLFFFWDLFFFYYIFNYSARYLCLFFLYGVT